MTTPPGDATCSLAVPAHVRMLPVVRLFTGSVARTWGADEAGVADLRVGASELAGAAMRSEPVEVVVELTRLPDRVVASVSPLHRSALEAGDIPAGDVVEGLFDEVRISGDAVSIAIGLVR